MNLQIWQVESKLTLIPNKSYLIHIGEKAKDLSLSSKNNKQLPTRKS